MFFSINKDVLLNSINIIQRGIPNKTTMPVYTGIKFEAINNSLIIISHSNDISIKTIIKDESLDIKDEGSILIPGRLFLEIIRKINTNTIDFSTIEDNLVVIKSGKSEFKLKTLDVLDYPEIYFIDDKESFKLNSCLINKLISKTNYSTATSERRPTLTGVNIKTEGTNIIAVGTDSYRLSRIIIDTKEELPQINVTIPNKSLDELQKTIETLDIDIDIFINNNKILFKFDNVLFQLRLLDGIFPNTNNVIPKEFPIKIKFNKNYLLEAVDRVSLLINKEKEYTYKLIGLFLRNDNLVEITCDNQVLGNALEIITPLEVESNTVFKIYASSKYIIDALSKYDSQEVLLSFSGETRPFIITSDKDEGFLNLILPVRYDQ